MKQSNPKAFFSFNSNIKWRMMFGIGDNFGERHSSETPMKTRDLSEQLKRSIMTVVGVLMVNSGFET